MATMPFEIDGAHQIDSGNFEPVYYLKSPDFSSSSQSE